jgi:O-antigen/teichoic acid export membrane protein
VSPLLAYLPGVLFLSIARSVGQDLGYQRRRTDLVLYANGMSLAVNLVMLFLLIDLLGAVGAAAASSVSYFAMMACMLLMHRGITGVRLRDVLVPRREDVRRLMAAVADVYRRLLRRRTAEAGDRRD